MYLSSIRDHIEKIFFIETFGGERGKTGDKLADIYMNFTKRIKCSVFGSAMTQIKLSFSFKFNHFCFPFSVFIFQVMLHKRTQK